MPSIASLARVLQTPLTTTAEEAARATGCVQLELPRIGGHLNRWTCMA